MIENRLCYISRCYEGTTSAGSKAKTDVEDILASMGAVNLGLRRSFRSSKIATFILNLCGVLRYCGVLRRGDRVVLQYPVKKYYTLLCRIAHWRGAKVVTLVHDLGSFRRKKVKVAQEITRLSHSDYVIATNETMRMWLVEHGLARPMGTLDVWDFLCDAQPAAPLDYEVRKRVLYAGALSNRKNQFIVQLAAMSRTYDLYLYGNYRNYTPALSGSNLYCHNFMPHERLISQVQAHYALVWDGDSTQSCVGDFGSYLQYNTPHKISLYLRMGLPLIVWKESAMAQFVMENGVGIVADSLHSLDALLQEIDHSMWLAMRSNVEYIAQRLQKGYYMRQAVEVACRCI